MLHTLISSRGSYSVTVQDNAKRFPPFFSIYYSVQYSKSMSHFAPFSLYPLHGTRKTVKALYRHKHLEDHGGNSALHLPIRGLPNSFLYCKQRRRVSSSHPFRIMPFYFVKFRYMAFILQIILFKYF